MKFSFPFFLTVLIAAPVFSQTLTESEGFSFVPSGSVGLTFDKFDTFGGNRVLEAMKVTVAFTRSGGSLAVDNDADTAGLVTLTHRVSGSLTSSVPFLTSSFTPLFSTSTLSAESSTTQMIGATSGDETDRFNATTGTDYYLWAPPAASIEQSANVGFLFFGNYTGPGTFDLFFEGVQSVTATGTSGLQQAITVADLTGNVTVEYTYSVIPEISTSVLAVISLSGFAMRRRRA